MIGRIVVASLLCFGALSARAQTCVPFTDVAANDPFCANVQWMYNRAITLGCTPTAYCPAQFVRRDQMAAFMNRLGNVTFQQGGNAFGGTAVLGTTDANPVEIRVDGTAAMRFVPDDDSPSIVGGHVANAVTAGVRGAVIGGGGVVADPEFSTAAPNRVTDIFGSVAGGAANRAGNDAGPVNDAVFAFVGGGLLNIAAANFTVVGGGLSNDATAPGSTIGGGAGNLASGQTATVGGGNNNIASGLWSTVAGGNGNTASGPLSAVGGGSNNVASGERSVVPGGSGSVAAGNYSFAAGHDARANFNGCFVYADASSGVNPTSCFAPNEIVIRGLGGFYFWTFGTSDDTYFGARLAPGTGAWATYSDRNGKREITPVDALAVLGKVVALPISTWQWKGESGAVRHMGPMAQDFHAAFGLGDTDTQIVTVDVDGVALAAIQGLNTKVEAQAREIDALKRLVERLLDRVR